MYEGRSAFLYDIVTEKMKMAASHRRVRIALVNTEDGRWFTDYTDAILITMAAIEQTCSRLAVQART